MYGQSILPFIDTGCVPLFQGRRDVGRLRLGFKWRIVSSIAGYACDMQGNRNGCFLGGSVMAAAVCRGGEYIQFFACSGLSASDW